MLYHLTPFHHVPAKLIRMHPRMISQNGTEVKLQGVFGRGVYLCEGSLCSSRAQLGSHVAVGTNQAMVWMEEVKAMPNHSHPAFVTRGHQIAHFERGIKQVGNAFVISRDFFILEVHCSGWWSDKWPPGPPSFPTAQVSFSTVAITQAQTHIAVYSKLSPKLGKLPVSSCHGVILAYVFLQGGGLFQQSSVMLKTRKSTHRRLTWFEHHLSNQKNPWWLYWGWNPTQLYGCF